jgi:FkbM family methyltransferase
MAFEPHPKLFQLLCANTAVNGLSNVRLYPAACAAEPGTLWFPELDYSREMNYDAFRVEEFRTSHQSVDQLPEGHIAQPVPIVALDDVYDLPALWWI